MRGLLRSLRFPHGFGLSARAELIFKEQHVVNFQNNCNSTIFLFDQITNARLKMGSLITEHQVTITSFEVVDLRFPTSLDGVGSDAMHVGTNGSHPYIRLNTNQNGLVGEGIVSPASVT